MKSRKLIGVYTGLLIIAVATMIMLWRLKTMPKAEVFPRDYPEIKEELDNAMRRLEDDNPFYLADLYKQYFSMDYTPILSGEEKKWLKNNQD